ncbi:helix-turn-helix domain-containing protein [Priestia aryabhattai]|uniref:Helix-turn-helix domain-containing protein n=1 Tax=Priestia aryabhattai TaxID=412384 RepID=A0AAX6NGY8_PRIAR|nr:helix-turn-helix domain-containing protein [Priestia aryabhattai]MDU9695158.1 helix-turn-helix domain-containing protein [Priestia aryabhattai]
MAKGKYEKWINEEGLVLLEGWARAGLTDEQIAHNVGVSRSTLNDWKKRYPDISDALKKGKEVVDLQVENALLKRALGYEYEEVTQESQWNEKTNKYELVITKLVKKRQAPDTTAQIFWLKNRRPDKWRDKQDVEHTGDMDLNIVIDYGEDNG